MRSMFTRITVILLLCLFFSACTTSPPVTKPTCKNKFWPCKPRWVIDKVPPVGEEGVIACSKAIFSSKKNKAISEAISGLAMQNGIYVDSQFKMAATESGTDATFKTKQGTQVTIKAEKHKDWSSPARVEYCVWMKQIK